MPVALTLTQNCEGGGGVSFFKCREDDKKNVVAIGPQVAVHPFCLVSLVESTETHYCAVVTTSSCSQNAVYPAHFPCVHICRHRL